jgi:flavin reductase (DIM6/NTAB) family NADH-FMN oxidoreductase RutF
LLTKLFRSRAPEPAVAQPPPLPEMPELTPEAFKTVFARLASSVAVVTFHIGRHVHGFTATSLTPVSMSPPMALFCVGRGNDSHRHLSVGTRVGISILSTDQAELSARFAGKAEPGGYADIALCETPRGEALIEGAVAGVAGVVSELIPAGDHTIYLCRLGGGVVGMDGDPLLYFSRDYWCLGGTLLSRPRTASDENRS